MMRRENAYNTYNKENPSSPRTMGELNSSIRRRKMNRVVLGLTLSISAIVGGILYKGDNADVKENLSKSSFTGKKTTLGKLDSSTQLAKKVNNLTQADISNMIMAEYEKIKNEENSSKETFFGNFSEGVKSVLSKIGFDFEKTNNDFDFYLLSKLSSKFSHKNKETLLENDLGRSVLSVYFSEEGSKKGSVFFLPIPARNPNNETFSVKNRGVSFSISPTPKSNGYNTEFDISTDKPGEAHQLSILYPSENKPNFSGKSISDFRYFSYIPYTKSLDNPRLHEIGINYLSQNVSLAYSQNFGKKFSHHSSSISGLRIGEAIPEYSTLILNIIERMDFMVYFEKDGKTLKSQKEIESIMEDQIHKALTTIGLNKENAFNLQKSPVGAVGIGQIMPGSFNLFKNHPKYNKFFSQNDFISAASDHQTSFRFQVAHYDDQIFQFPSVVRDNWSNLLEDEKTRVGLFSILAAGYNGSMKRVVGEVFGDLGEKNNLRDYKKRLSVDQIVKQMTIARNDRIELTQKNISELKVKLKNKRLKKLQRDSILANIKQLENTIFSINSTYKESMTYVLKTDFVIKYLYKNHSGVIKK